MKKKKSSSRSYSKKRFTPSEDQIIISLVKPNGENDWSKIAKSLEKRTARQCRDRWNNYLNPSLNKDDWNPEEDELLLKLFEEKGPQWKTLSNIFNGRSINNVRNRCFKLVRKKKKNSKSGPLLPPKEHVMKSTTNDNIKMNLFDQELLSNFDSFPIDINSFIEELEDSLRK